MKLISIILSVIVLTFNSCGSAKNKANDNKRMEFTITKIQNEKDGQTLFLKDDKNREFTTVISIPNGNFIKVETGNHISLIAREILERHPAIIISEDIKVLDNNNPFTPKYEKTEEEIYWINARKTQANGMVGNIIDCLQFQQEKTLNKNGEWKVICDQIKHFNYVEGNYYQIKVAKKWLKDHKFLADRSPYDLELIEVISKEKDPTYVSSINISTNKTTYKLGEAIELSMQIKNTSEKPYRFLPWGTPLENRFTRECLQILYNGQKVPYSGIIVKRVAPTEKDYITLKKGEIYNGKVNVLNGYKLTKKGTYTIQFEEKYDGMPASNVVMITIV